MNQHEQQTNDANTKLNDLAVAETEQAEIKGGPKKIFIGGLSVKETAAALPDLEPNGEIKGGRTDGSGQGGPVFNHNETTVEDEEAETEALDDLAVNGADEIKGGIGTDGGIWRGVSVINHNETVAADEEAETEAPEDLEVTEDQKDELKGGYPGRVIIGYGAGGGINHN